MLFQCFNLICNAIFISEEDNILMYENVSKEEILSVMPSLHKEKNVGPNGWTIEFLWVSLSL